MFKNFNKIAVIVLIFLVTLALLFGAYFFYGEFFVKQPLSFTLNNSELINNYQLDNDRKNPVLKVKLNNVDNLSEEFQSFLATSGQTLTEKDLQLELYSVPSTKLLDYYQEINPSIYEALALNKFTKLEKKLEEKNQQYNLTEIKLTISQDYLYLQLEDQDNYLYCIFNRNDDSFPRIINNIGSDIK